MKREFDAGAVGAGTVDAGAVESCSMIDYSVVDHRARVEQELLLANDPGSCI